MKTIFKTHPVSIDELLQQSIDNCRNIEHEMFQNVRKAIGVNIDLLCTYSNYFEYLTLCRQIPTTNQQQIQ